MERFLQKHPNYYSTYYKKNILKFRERNKNRPSTKKIHHCIEIEGKKYLFPTLKSMKIHKVNVNEIDTKNYHLIG